MSWPEWEGGTASTTSDNVEGTGEGGFRGAAVWDPHTPLLELWTTQLVSP